MEDNLPEDTGGPVDGEPQIEESPLPELIRRWRNEKYAPELLPCDKVLIKETQEVMDFVQEGLQEECGAGSAATPEQSVDQADLAVREVELQRVRYVLKDYLRLRLWKLCQWPQHYLEKENIDLLSDAERTFLRDFWANKEKFFQDRLLQYFPAEHYRKLDSQLDMFSMIRRPEMEKHVYARIMKYVGTINVPPTYSQSENTSGEQASTLTLDEGSTYLLQWSVVRKFFFDPQLDGKVNLV